MKKNDFFGKLKNKIEEKVKLFSKRKGNARAIQTQQLTIAKTTSTRIVGNAPLPAKIQTSLRSIVPTAVNKYKVFHLKLASKRVARKKTIILVSSLVTILIIATAAVGGVMGYLKKHKPYIPNAQPTIYKKPPSVLSAPIEIDYQDPVPPITYLIDWTSVSLSFPVINTTKPFDKKVNKFYYDFNSVGVNKSANFVSFQKPEKGDGFATPWPAVTDQSIVPAINKSFEVKFSYSKNSSPSTTPASKFDMSFGVNTENLISSDFAKAKTTPPEMKTHLLSSRKFINFNKVMIIGNKFFGGWQIWAYENNDRIGMMWQQNWTP